VKTLSDEEFEDIPGHVLWVVFKNRYSFLESSGYLDEAVDLSEDDGFLDETKIVVGEKLTEWEACQRRRETVTIEETTQFSVSFLPVTGKV
jgi:hypothetical protein